MNKVTANTQNTQNKNQPIKSVVTNVNNAKNQKGQIIPVVEEEIKPPPPREKNIERFIYITNYYDTESMKILKELFESINKEAFQLKSVKEVYTKNLSHEEQDNNEIDYISGFQLIDKNLRITILEGITGKGMKLIKEKMPKLEINNSNKKLFSDSRTLYNERIYSKFNLCLKFIKLRDSLNHILTTYDIYMKANKYKEIYTAFMNLGFILESQTFWEISNANLFPQAESMLLLERKYADILNDEDLTAVPTPHKIKKKRTKAELLEKNSGFTLNSTLPATTEFNIISSTLTLSTKEKTKNISETKNNTLTNSEEKYKNTVAKLDSRNLKFDEFLEQNKNKQINFYEKNLEFIKLLNDKEKPKNFCQHHKKYNNKISEHNNNVNNDEIHEESKSNTAKRSSILYTNYTSEGNKLNNLNSEVTNKIEEKVYLYSSQRKNYYADYFDKMRESYEKDKDNFYTFSKDYLTLSFPMIKNSNVVFDEFMENKKVKFIFYILETR